MKYLVFVIIGCFVLHSCGTGGGKIGNTSNLKVQDMPVLYQSPNIFSSYNKKADSKLATTWVRKFDASGISFNSNRTCTLVTPQHVVMAAHFQRNVGDVVVFHDGEGKFIQSTITAKKRVIGDVAVGVLDKPLPSSYTPYPLLRARAGLEDDLKQEYILVTDKARRVFVHQVRAVYNQNIGFLFDASKKIGYGKRLIVGDSGNPSFIMVNGKQALIETHTAGGAGAGPFYGNAEVQQALASKIKELGGVGTLRYVDWPKK